MLLCEAGRHCTKEYQELGGIALIKPILDDGVGVKDIVDRLCPMQRNWGITNGEAVEVMIMMDGLTSPLHRLRFFED
jgi:hypothetical protein